MDYKEKKILERLLVLRGYKKGKYSDYFSTQHWEKEQEIKGSVFSANVRMCVSIIEHNMDIHKRDPYSYRLSAVMRLGDFKVEYSSIIDEFELFEKKITDLLNGKLWK